MVSVECREIAMNGSGHEGRTRVTGEGPKKKPRQGEWSKARGGNKKSKRVRGN